jgi:hypothetical protein
VQVMPDCSVDTSAKSYPTACRKRSLRCKEILCGHLRFGAKPLMLGELAAPSQMMPRVTAARDTVNGMHGTMLVEWCEAW